MRRPTFGMMEMVGRVTHSFDVLYAIIIKIAINIIITFECVETEKHNASGVRWLRTRTGEKFDRKVALMGRTCRDVLLSCKRGHARGGSSFNVAFVVGM